MTPKDRETRRETLEIVDRLTLKRGEIPLILWEEKRKRYVIEIAKPVASVHNSG